MDVVRGSQYRREEHFAYHFELSAPHLLAVECGTNVEHLTASFAGSVRHFAVEARE